MGQVLLYIIFAATMVAALRAPWIGVVAGYTFIMLAPQNIWPWNFGDWPHFKLVAIPTILGTFFALMSGQVRFDRLKSRTCFLFGIWWLFVNVSYLFGPYVHVDEFRIFDAHDALDTMNKSFIFLFIGVICIDRDEKLRYLILVAVVTCVYLSYWATDQYLSGRGYGRLRGPGFTDENGFAVIFVITLPYVWFFGVYLKRRLLKIALWLTIPFGWHAIFLTGSRGALLAVGVTLVVASLCSKQSRLVLLAIPLFAVAYSWQGGSMLKLRASTILTYETDASATSRLAAWGAAIGMIKSHPITGVGLASFTPAFSDFSSEQPRSAHNTLFQIGAESGVFAALAWMGIIGFSVLVLFRAKIPDRELTDDERFLVLMGNATLVSLAGFGACATFLSLQRYESFFYLGLVGAYVMGRRIQLFSESGSISTSVPASRRQTKVPIVRSGGHPYGHDP